LIPVSDQDVHPSVTWAGSVKFVTVTTLSLVADGCPERAVAVDAPGRVTRPRSSGSTASGVVRIPVPDQHPYVAPAPSTGMITTDLSDRVALVTGSADGIGREFALSLAEAGAAVAVHYHTSETAARATAAVAREASGTAITVQGDVTDPDEVDTMFDAVESELGSVELLVNNVGDFAPRHWEDIDFETWNRVLETNLNGTYLCSKRALPGMREASFGRIVNVGYAGTDRALVYPKNFPYFVAKTGVIMFTRMLANDTIDDGVTVNCLSPYVVETSDEFPDEAPRGRWATVSDLRQVLFFFLDPDSEYVSGENVEIDGGWIPETL
jgi:NAD(P)-dependent dehydrogenase (short-subunit alcohol dehydrogenase family)